MADEKPKTVKVEALEDHTYNGKAYEIGDEYEIEEQFANSVVVQGKAKRVDSEAAPKAKASSPVKPMTTDDFPNTKKK